MTSYADDSTVHSHSKNIEPLKENLERLSEQMIKYCHDARLILNSDKTQFLVSPKQDCKIKVGPSIISSSPEMNLLGVDFDSNFTTLPYLHKLACSAKTRANLIYRLSFSMPPHVLSKLANGLLMGKILSACPVTIPVKFHDDDKCFKTVTEEINMSIKATARTITKTKLSDKIRSEDVLGKAKLKCLNEAVACITATTIWKSKQSMDSLGNCLFQEKPISRPGLRSETSKGICPSVPGYPTMATNVMSKVWNSAPGLETASSLGAAKAISKEWAKTFTRQPKDSC